MKECSTKREERKEEGEGQLQREAKLSNEMEKGLAQFQKKVDLDTSARECGALNRHRGVKNGSDLLMVVLGYSVLDKSLRMLGIWCTTKDVCEISKTALLHHLEHCENWLRWLIVKALQQHVEFMKMGSVEVRLCDATVICEPGSKGTDWRMHLGFNLGRMVMDWFEITDQHGGESLTRFTMKPGEIWIADRGYATAKNVGYVVSQEAWALLRIGWQSLKLTEENGKRWDLIGWLKKAELVPAGAPQEIERWVNHSQGRCSIRLIAQALPQEKAEEARHKLRQIAAKKGRTVDDRTLFAAGFTLLLTTLPRSDWCASQVLQLYRFRWQIELVFKRLKSILNLDGLRARTPKLARVYLLAKLLAALILDQVQLEIADQYPDWFTDTYRPLSLWRLTALLWDHFCSVVRGPFTLSDTLRVFPKLHRYLCDEPRKRTSQRALAQSLFGNLCA